MSNSIFKNTLRIVLPLLGAVLVNLLSGWLQPDIFRNTFAPSSIIGIVIASLAISVWLFVSDRQSARLQSNAKTFSHLLDRAFPPPKQQALSRLLELFIKHFDTEELKTLCFHLGVDYDDLPAEGRANKARELIAYLDQHNRLSDLIRIGRDHRPDVSWDTIDDLVKQAPLTPVPAPSDMTGLESLADLGRIALGQVKPTAVLTTFLFIVAGSITVAIGRLLLDYETLATAYPVLFWILFWMGLCSLPLIIWLLPQQREPAIQAQLSPRQRWAYRLDKLGGLYIGAFLAEFVVLVVFLGLVYYLNLWVVIPSWLKLIFWLLAQWFILALSAIGAVINTTYWRNILEEPPKPGLNISHFILAFGFPLIVYPVCAILGSMLFPILSDRTFGLLFWGLFFLLLAFLWRRENSAQQQPSA